MYSRKIDKIVIYFAYFCAPTFIQFNFNSNCFYLPLRVIKCSGLCGQFSSSPNRDLLNQNVALTESDNWNERLFQNY